MTTAATNRYANDWNTYSAAWDDHYGTRYRHLGDEWCDDGTAERRRDEHIFATIAQPWLRPDARVVEIGPGGGKWTVRLAPRVGEVIAFDVADAMLSRTRERCAGHGLQNVSFVLGDGNGLLQIADASVDMVFSYDVFVHIALEDTVAYIAEMARVLRLGGVAVIHHAVDDVTSAMDRIETHNDWYRSGATLGQYYYHSHPALRGLYERAGLEIVSTWSEHCTTTFTVRRPGGTTATRLELAIRRAAVAETVDTLDAAAGELEATAAEQQARIAALITAVRGAAKGQERYAALQKLRRAFRG